MPTIHVTASREYDVVIERGILARCGEMIKAATDAGAAAVISDDNVYRLYGEAVVKSLTKAGFRVVHFVFRHGEQSKTFDTYEKILYFLSENHMTRKDVLVALGGGITGDMTGFAAATYQRGLPFVQIPTTLLAAVDSSVGGKTAINLRTGKNQVGSFYQPHLVLCDPDTLSTLPEEEYRCGAAEVIKYSILGDADFFRALSEKKAEIEDIIEKCVKMKRDIVREDEFDRGTRQLLNLGHTVGHAVEAAGDFSILHGQAVAVGMAVMARAACKFGICTRETAEDIESILRRYDLPTETEFTADVLYEAALSDKKLSGSKLTLVVPEKIGHCRLITISVAELRDWLLAGGIRE